MDESKFNYIPFWTRFIFPALCLYAGTIISTYAWEHINLPFSNPSGARGILPALQYHPANNAGSFFSIYNPAFNSFHELPIIVSEICGSIKN
jgi:hypothetical protein